MNLLFLKLAKKKSLLNLAILFLCVNCTQPAKKVAVENDGVRTIDIISNISNTKKVDLSTIASYIEYCMLETDGKCLIGNKNIYCSGDYIVSMGKYCYVFERKTGNFVRQISDIGQGPGEYQMTISVLAGDKGQICLLGNNKLLFFNLDGTLSHTINRFTPSVMYSFVAHEDLYVGYVPNLMGNSTIRIAFFDNKTGELIDSIPNHRSYNQTEGIPRSTGADFLFYTFNNSLNYKDIYCDTLYQIKEFTLQPRYAFYTGGRAFPYELQDEGRIDVRAAMRGGDYDRYARYIVINRMHESAKFLYFTFDYRVMQYPAIYDKVEGKIQIMSPVSIPPPPFITPYPLYGFENDLDGGLPFWPQQMVSEKEMMCVYSAEELLELDVSKITDEKLKYVLNSLEADSNPVVVIVTLKD